MKKCLVLLFAVAALSQTRGQTPYSAEAARSPHGIANPSRAIPPACQSKRRLLIPQPDGGFDLRAPGIYAYHPGDTLVIRAGLYTYFHMDNFKGASSCPLVIINEGGQVRFEGIRGGFHITNSSYLKITGTGSKDKYGFFIEGDPVFRFTDGMALLVHLRSKNVELNNIQVHNMGFGFVCRTDNYCEDSLTYPHWVLDSISIHDCRIVGVWYEGMYLGNTSPDNAADSYDPRPIVCSGDTVYPLPMRNGHMQVYNNYVDSTGRGGIQMASASFGESEIAHNIVKHSGLNGDTDQGTGISVGTYTHVDIHDNTVSCTFTSGIASLGGSGTGQVLGIENNHVDSSGYLRHYGLVDARNTRIDPAEEPSFADTLRYPCAIYLGSRSTLFRDSTTFCIKDNTIGSFRSAAGAIQVQDAYRTITSSGNSITGNKNAATGTPATIFADNSHGPIYYSDKP